jgi:response regulator NasT
MSRVVIADDEAVIRIGLSQMVSALGYHVVGTAANGHDALDKTRQLRPDLLLLDIKMPDLDGLAVAEIIAKEMPLPIVMITAYSERRLIERAVNAAVMGYLVKPIHEQKLGPMLSLAANRFEIMRTKAQEAYRLKGQLEARRLIDAAKQILVATGISEAEAYKRLQMAARRKRRPMHEVAEAVVAIGAKV